MPTSPGKQLPTRPTIPYGNFSWSFGLVWSVLFCLHEAFIDHTLLNNTKTAFGEHHTYNPYSSWPSLESRHVRFDPIPPTRILSNLTSLQPYTVSLGLDKAAIGRTIVTP